MRQLCFAVMACLVLSSCEDILPVDNIDRCAGDAPASAECDQCAGENKPAGCPQCRGDNPAAGCQNASGVSGGGKAGSTAGDGGSDSSGAGGAGAGNGGGSGTASGGSGGGSAGAAGNGSGSGGNGGSTSESGTGGSAAGSSGAGSGGNAGQSGSSGDGGMQTPPCDGQDDCANPTPQCTESGACVACDSDAACTGKSGVEHCELRTGAAFPGQCVACTSHAHCTDPKKPQCGANGACEPCTGNDACSERAGTTKCDVANGSPLQGRCVQCLAHGDCSAVSRAECSAQRVCSPCTSDEACSERSATSKCNLYPGAAAQGHCVECTGENESVCNGKSCKRSTGTCTNTTLRDVGLCEPCEADSECSTDARCVAHSFMGQALGSFCFYTDPDSNNCATDSSSSRRPYSRRVTDTNSIDGAAGPFCLPIATCQAVTDAIAGKHCTMNQECGVQNLNDGYCLATDKCSYLCTQSHECLESGVTTCSAPGGSGFCQ